MNDIYLSLSLFIVSGVISEKDHSINNRSHFIAAINPTEAENTFKSMYSKATNISFISVTNIGSFVHFAAKWKDERLNYEQT